MESTMVVKQVKNRLKLLLVVLYKPVASLPTFWTARQKLGKLHGLFTSAELLSTSPEQSFALLMKNYTVISLCFISNPLEVKKALWLKTWGMYYEGFVPHIERSWHALHGPRAYDQCLLSLLQVVAGDIEIPVLICTDVYSHGFTCGNLFPGPCSMKGIEISWRLQGQRLQSWFKEQECSTH